MIALLQRVAEAAVLVNGTVVGSAGPGTLALVAVERGDGSAQLERLLQRLLAWRMFPDEQGRMNRDLRQVEGDLLLVPQFTLAADTRSGNRPSFTPAAPPEEGRRRFEEFVDLARTSYPRVASGVFGADMKVRLVNDGPVTFWLQVRADA